MPTWKKLSTPMGEFISPVFDISNNLNNYLATIETEVINIHNQGVEYYFRISDDNYIWSQWERFYETSYGFLSEVESLASLYIQFKVIVNSETLDKSPYFQKLSVSLKPFQNIENKGDLTVKPKLWIKKRNGDGDIAIINNNTQQRVEFTDLNNDEEIYIDCENEEIISSNQDYGVYRYDSHNDEYLELIRGENYLTFEGDFDLDIRYKAILLQE